MTKQDINFDPLFDRFQKNIYGGIKGQVRERLIKEQLDKHLEILPGMSVADIGGGLGQMSQWFLERGATVDYFDLSERMLESAKETLKQHSKHIEFKLGAFQRYLEKQYDIVFCQAVLEWLEEPIAGLNKLSQHLKPGGQLILMFYNLDSIKLRNLVRGNLNAAFGDLSGNGTGLTPINPLEAESIWQALDDLKLQRQHHFGIRCFTDLQDKKVQQRLGADTLFEFERELCEKEPYRSLARYIAVIAKAPE
ncbi:methyltransferase [Agaribacterium haliotis]|uniref:methyltransferase n=1 Tax=Agaribacterium haliotis TaxID=2013869 RepID=UPI000BB5872C|nr:methyltransferase [Agaribacterium haliotis]